jgi:peptide deformylase
MLALVHNTNSALITPTQPFDFANPPVHPEELVNNMLMVMAEQKGIGLAANQLGLPYSVFVCHGDPFACFNPRIVDVSQEEVLLDEACLTWPGLYVKVKRPKSIRVRFTTIKGQVETQKYTGMTARVIQHEIDHLNGKLFFNAATKYHKDQAFRKYKTYQRHPERFTAK